MRNEQGGFTPSEYETLDMISEPGQELEDSFGLHGPHALDDSITAVSPKDHRDIFISQGLRYIKVRDLSSEQRRIANDRDDAARVHFLPDGTLDRVTWGKDKGVDNVVVVNGKGEIIKNNPEISGEYGAVDLVFRIRPLHTISSKEEKERLKHPEDRMEVLLVWENRAAYEAYQSAHELLTAAVFQGHMNPDKDRTTYETAFRELEEESKGKIKPKSTGRHMSLGRKEFTALGRKQLEPSTSRIVLDYFAIETDYTGEEFVIFDDHPVQQTWDHDEYISYGRWVPFETAIQAIYDMMDPKPYIAISLMDRRLGIIRQAREEEHQLEEIKRKRVKKAKDGSSANED